MSLRRPAVALAATAGWLLLTSGYGAAAAEPAVDLGGAPLPEGTGSTDRAAPTVLEPGLWADTLGDAQSGESVHHFRYDRQMRSSTVHVGVIGASTDPDGDGIEVEIFGPEQVSCATSYESPGYVGFASFGARAWAGPSEPGLDDEDCTSAASLGIEVTRSSGDDHLPIAIKVVEEAPVTGTEDLPPPEESPSFRAGAEPAGGGTDLVGATAFDSAPAVPLSSGASEFSTSVTEGQQRLYKVPLAWGQQLSVDALVPTLDEAIEEERSFSTPTVELTLVDPVRDTVDDAVDGLTSSGSYSSDEVTRLSAGLPALSYLNRYASGPASMPGDYWLSIAVDVAPEDVEPLAVPIDVAVDVAEATEGAPVYQGTVQSPDGGQGPAAYTPETPYLIGPDEFSAVASGNPVPADDEDEGWWGPRRYAGIGLAVASLLCCGLGARRLLR